MGFIGKILLTVGVIVIVYFTYRNRTAPPTSEVNKNQEDDDTTAISPQMLAYIFVGLIVAISILIYSLNRFQQHKIINIRVINAASQQTQTYQAYKKSISGRSFETLDGVTVTIGESERVEMIEVD